METFFSYARSDAVFALKLAKDLKSAGKDVWLDQLDINPGSRWDDAVENALKACPRFLIILSPASVASHNVMDEVSFAIENNKKIVPVLYQNCDIPFRLKRLQYIDFTRSYDEGITRLLPVLGDNSSSFPLPPKDSPTAILTKRTKMRRIVSTIRNHPGVLAIVFLFMIIIGIGIFTDALDGILPSNNFQSTGPKATPSEYDQKTNYNEGVKNLQAGKYDLAINDFSQVIRGNPNHARAYYNRGVCYQKTGQNDKAIDDFKKFLELSNDTDLRPRAEYNLRNLGVK